MLWKDIPHYEGVYQVSFGGHVKRVAGSVNCPSDRPLKPRIGAGGYWSVALSQYGVVKETPVHRCVASAFIGLPPSPLHQVNHKDGDKLNNHPDNLEWVTPSENIRHAVQTGLKVAKRGKDRCSTKLSDKQVMDIRRRFAAGEKHHALSKEFGVAAGHIRDIAYGRKWSYLPVLDNKAERGKHFMKLTVSDVSEIRELRKRGWKIKDIAAKYGVSGPTISNTVNGKYHAP